MKGGKCTLKEQLGMHKAASEAHYKANGFANDMTCSMGTRFEAIRGSESHRKASEAARAQGGRLSAQVALYTESL